MANQMTMQEAREKLEEIKANIDSAETASSIGVSSDRAYDFAPSAKGIGDMMCCCMAETRKLREIK